MVVHATTHIKQSLNTVIIGGHGNIALRLGKYLTTAGHSVTSVIRSDAHAVDIEAFKATPKVLSLEGSPASDFSSLFQNRDLIYFTAGAGGKGGVERTRKVDYEGALKVFDAIDGVKGAKPKLVMLSAIDVRDVSKTPAHYNEEDKAASERGHGAIGEYMKAKYDADKNLVQRTFDWFILRPSGLTNDEGTGKVNIGAQIHITNKITRDDVAHLLFLLATRPQAAKMALDATGGETPIESALDAAIEKGESAFDV